MGNQASNTTGFDLSSSPSGNRRSRNFSTENSLKNARTEQIQSTLINCFALGDDMIHYLWKFYDLDHNNELDIEEMRTFLKELIHTLHDVCLRSEILAYETGKKREAPQMGHASQATTTTSTAASTNEVSSTSSSASNSSNETIEKKKSRFGLFKKKNRMSTDLQEKKTSTPLWRRSRNLSDEDSMKRRSVAVIPGAGLINNQNFEQMISGNTEQDEIKKRWKAIREHMESNIDDIIKKVDIDQDGTINYQEFLSFMKNYDIKDMLNNMEPSLASPNLLDGKIFGLFSDGMHDDNASDVSSPRSVIMEQNPASPQTKEGRRKSAIFQVLAPPPSSSTGAATASSTESELPSLDLPSNKKPLNKGDLLNTVIFATASETLDFLSENQSSIDRIELNAALRRAIVDNNPSKTRVLLKYGASICQSFKDENQEENPEGFDMLTTSLLKALSSYSPCMDGDEIEKLQLIIRLLISKGWFDDHSTSQFKQLTPDIIYECIVSHNDSMSMYEDELREALGETKSFEEIESEYSSQLED